MPVCPRDVDRKFLEKPTLPRMHGVAETEVGRCPAPLVAGRAVGFAKVPCVDPLSPRSCRVPFRPDEADSLPVGVRTRQYQGLGPYEVLTHPAILNLRHGFGRRADPRGRGGRDASGAG